MADVKVTIDDNSDIPPVYITLHRDDDDVKIGDLALTKREARLLRDKLNVLHACDQLV